MPSVSNRMPLLVPETGMGTTREQGSVSVPEEQTGFHFDPKLQWDADTAAFRDVFRRARVEAMSIDAFAAFTKGNKSHISEAENGLAGRTITLPQIARLFQEKKSLDLLVDHLCRRAKREIPGPAHHMTTEEARARFHKKAREKFGQLAEMIRAEIAADEGCSVEEVPL